MARGQTLGKLLTDLRAEIGFATDSTVGQSENPALKVLLQRTQEILYDEYDWPHMQGVWYDVTLSAGQRYYDIPSQINYERAVRAQTLWGNIWSPISYGFDTSVYNLHDSDNDQRADPPEKWRLYSATKFECWPMPATNGGKIRFIGTRKLATFEAESDVADLDDRLIVLFAAAERMAGKPRGKALTTLAGRRLAILKARSNKSDSFRVGETRDNGANRPHELVVRVAGGA
jgi:hypothetical protein